MGRKSGLLASAPGRPGSGSMQPQPMYMQPPAPIQTAPVSGTVLPSTPGAWNAYNPYAAAGIPTPQPQPYSYASAPPAQSPGFAPPSFFQQQPPQPQMGYPPPQQQTVVPPGGTFWLNSPPPPQ